MDDKHNKPKAEGNGEEEPQVFAVSYEAGKPAFSRKEFLELAAAASVAATALGCQISGKASQKRDPSPMPRLIDTLAPTLTKTAVQVPPTDTPKPTDTEEPRSQPTHTPRPTATPQPSATPSATATQVIEAKVRKGNVNLRSGPGTYYDKIGTTKQDESILVISRNQEGTWLHILNSEKLDCWIAVEFVSLPGEIDEVPIEANIPPAPTAMPGTVPAGSTGINFTLDGVTYTQRCGAPLPPGAVCTCNCVTVPPACGCDGDTGGGGCDGHGPSHYWHPN